MDAMQPQSKVATRSDAPAPHPEWGDHDRSVLDRIEPRFVVVSWLWGLGTTLAFASIASAVYVLVTGRALTGDVSAEFGVLGLIFAFSTFIGFVVTMFWRLVRVEHDRLTNSMAVAALHVAFAVVLFGIELSVRAATGTGLTENVEGGWAQEVGNGFLALERSAAASVIACLLAVGMVPARGPRPRGTQHAERNQDAQL